MNKEQIEIAEKRVKEFKRYNLDNEAIREFIEKVKTSQFLDLSTAYQYDMEFGSKETYELVGVELVEILEKKLREREIYLESMNADDLIM